VIPPKVQLIQVCDYLMIIINGRKMMAEQYLYLTTTGWKSGKAHEIEIWYVEHEGRYYLVAERREQSHWVQNIQHNPAVTWRVGSQTFSGTGRTVSEEPDLMQAVRARMDAKYDWSDGLIVELQA
jgi:deazaflavin-dependent oxidoreductase (nitroreductase family)